MGSAFLPTRLQIKQKIFMAKKISILLLFLIASNTSYSYDYYSCGEWNKNRKKSINEKQKEERNFFLQRNEGEAHWFRGFLVYSLDPPYLPYIKDINIEDIKVWLNNYCLQYPAHDFHDAANNLKLEIKAAHELQAEMPIKHAE